MITVMIAHLRAMLYSLGFAQNELIMTSVVTSLLLAGLPKNTATDPKSKASPAEGSTDDDASVLRRVTACVEIICGKTGLIVRKAYEQALEGALMIEGLTKSHRMFYLIVTLGVVMIVRPEFITLLGFAGKGPAAGSFAALWQSIYGGAVPTGSLFAYFQHLGAIGGSLISLL